MLSCGVEAYRKCDVALKTVQADKCQRRVGCLTLAQGYLATTALHGESGRGSHSISRRLHILRSGHDPPVREEDTDGRTIDAQGGTGGRPETRWDLVAFCRGTKAANFQPWLIIEILALVQRSLLEIAFLVAEKRVASTIELLNCAY
jgi:hypothetical protein